MADDSYSMLSKIKSPSDIKSMGFDELEELACQIRKKLIEVTSKNGGHLASNLGVVELTIALHYIFNTPSDSIVWDVGHQSYVHKLLTGRYEQFDTLRQPGGLSGFTDPDESEHDVFFSGHSSTSISAAYGIAEANRLADKTNAYTVAVIGDGSFTGGLAYEALNNAGRSGSNLIVILNDNEMSISENVGTFAQHLARVKASPRYFNLKRQTERTLNRIPVVGEDLSNLLFKIKTSLKKAIYSKSTLFEDLGFRYVGPIDGHNLPTLVDALRAARSAHYPMLIHVKTVKGKGFEFAEKNPDMFHGISQFDIFTGETKQTGDSFSEEFGSYLCSAAEKDERICAVTAAMSLGTGLEPFKKKFPARFFDVGIAEQHAVTFSSGLAKGGMIPVFAVYSAFLQRSYDQLIHDAALQKVHMVVVVDRAGFVTGDGETHHGLFDVAFLNTIPGVKIYAPSDYRELKAMLDRALFEDEGLCVIRIPKGAEPENKVNRIGSVSGCDVIGDDGAGKAVVSYGRVFSNALSAAEKLTDTKLVKLNTLKPIAPEAVEACLNCREVYFFEEGQRIGGAGEEFLYELENKGFTGKFELTAVDDRFVPHSTAELLLKEFRLDTDGIISTAEGSGNG